MQSAAMTVISDKPEAVGDLLNRISEAVKEAENGYSRTLDDRHSVSHIRRGRTLLVTFERAEKVSSDDDARPIGHSLSEAFGWSCLTILAEAATWFRAEAVYAYFDELIDTEFFEDFESVVFYGAGAAGYAACAYSVAAPGSIVIAISPQATLDPLHAGWDTRFKPERRVDFTSRFGYAPLMCEAAREVHIFFDPGIELDACHAAQFNQSHMKLHRLRNYGTSPDEYIDREDMEALVGALEQGRSAPHDIARVFRKRREKFRYLRRLLGRLLNERRTYLAALLCRSVVTRYPNASRFAVRLNDLTKELEENGQRLPELNPGS